MPNQVSSEFPSSPIATNFAVVPTGKSASRTVADKLGQDLPSVRDWNGIDPTGNNDCSSNFTSAAAENRLFLVPQGTYRTNFTLPGGSFLLGDGITSAILKSADNTKPIISIGGTDLASLVRRWGIAGIKLDGENIAQPLIKVGWAGFGTLDHLWLFGAKDAGLRLTAGVYDSQFTNIYINWCGRDDRTRGPITIEGDTNSGCNRLTFMNLDCETFRGPGLVCKANSSAKNHNKINFKSCKWEAGAVGSETGLGDIILDFQYTYQATFEQVNTVGWGNRDTSGGAIAALVQIDSCGMWFGDIDGEIQSAYSPVSTYGDFFKFIGTVYGFDVVGRYLASANDALMLNSSGILMSGRPVGGYGGISHNPGFTSLGTRDIRFDGGYSTSANVKYASNTTPAIAALRVIGDFVRNTAPAEAGSAAAKYMPIGWMRNTTAAADVLGTDWQRVRTLTGN